MKTTNHSSSSVAQSMQYGSAIDFICSKCGSTDIERQGSLFFCMDCGATHPITDSFYNGSSSSENRNGYVSAKLPHFLIFLVSFLTALILSMLTFALLCKYTVSLPLILAFTGFWGITASALYLIYLLKT